jgi:hypothetical protein
MKSILWMEIINLIITTEVLKVLDSWIKKCINHEIKLQCLQTLCVCVFVDKNQKEIDIVEH